MAEVNLASNVVLYHVRDQVVLGHTDVLVAVVGSSQTQQSVEGILT